jgi:hypothetical protein
MGHAHDSETPGLRNASDPDTTGEPAVTARSGAAGDLSPMNIPVDG